MTKEDLLRQLHEVENRLADLRALLEENRVRLTNDDLGVIQGVMQRAKREKDQIETLLRAMPLDDGVSGS